MRMHVNPEPLKTVTTKAGEPEPVGRRFVVATLWSVNKPGVRQRIRRISIHREGCSRIPLHWHSEARDTDGVSRALSLADSHDAQCAIGCRTCGGWTVT